MFTDHSKQVRMVDWAVPFFAPIQVGPVQDSGHHKTKVGSKCVDGHGAAGVLGLKNSQQQAGLKNKIHLMNNDNQ